MIDKILCVDDDPITLMLCRKVIVKAEFAKETDAAQNGEEALQYFDNLLVDENKDIPKLILLDLNMPVMGGWEFLDNFSHGVYRSAFNDVKVIVLSSTIDPEDVEKAKKYEMVVDFVSKPITIEMLTEIKRFFTT